MSRQSVALIILMLLSVVGCATKRETVELKPMPVEQQARTANQCTAQCNGRTLSASCEPGHRAECVCEPESFTRCRPATGTGDGMVRVGTGAMAAKPSSAPAVTEPSRVDRLRGK